MEKTKIKHPEKNERLSSNINKATDKNYESVTKEYP